MNSNDLSRVLGRFRLAAAATLFAGALACGDDPEETNSDAGVRPDATIGLPDATTVQPDATVQADAGQPDATESNPDATTNDDASVVPDPVPEIIPFSATGHDRLLNATFDTAGNLYAVGYVADSTVSADFNMILTKRTAAGAVDPNFGDAGNVRLNLAAGGTAETPRGLVLQSTGKIVVSSLVEAVGSNDPRDRDVALARFNVDGSLDMDFGTNGISIISITTGTISGNNYVADGTWGLSAFADDDLLVVGSAAAPGRTDADFALVRLTPDGELDNEFASGGVFLLNDPVAGASPRTATILADGSVVSAGYFTVSGIVQPVLFKVSGSGELDPNFGVGGVYTEIVLASVTEAYAASPQGNNFITAGYGRDDGSESLDWISLRITGAGELDETWGTAGVVRIDVAGFNDNARTLLTLPDDRVLLAGGGRPTMEDNDAMVAVLTRDGAPDTTFAPNGYKLWDLGAVSDFFWGVAISADEQRVALVGTKQVANNSGGNDDSAILIIPTP